MEIKTPCTDDAIIVLDNFRLVASFRGVVAQGFGPLGYWKESDFDDEDSRRLMVGDFFQFRDIYIEQESRLKNNVYDKVLEINEELLDSPELLNDDPYANWIIKVENVSDTEELLSAAAYADLCETEA